MSLPSPPVSRFPARRGALLFTLLGLFAAAGARAQLAVDLVTTDDLGFGKIVATGTPGTVTVTPSGGRDASGGAALGGASGVSAAGFTATGLANASFSITLPLASVLTSGLRSMTADSFTSFPSGSANLGPGGSQTVRVGATLHLGASQGQGAYSGTFVVIVSYN